MEANLETEILKIIGDILGINNCGREGSRIKQKKISIDAGQWKEGSTDTTETSEHRRVLESHTEFK